MKSSRKNEDDASHHCELRGPDVRPSLCWVPRSNSLRNKREHILETCSFMTEITDEQICSDLLMLIVLLALCPHPCRSTTSWLCKNAIGLNLRRLQARDNLFYSQIFMLFSCTFNVVFMHCVPSDANKYLLCSPSCASALVKLGEDYSSCTPQLKPCSKIGKDECVITPLGIFQKSCPPNSKCSVQPGIKIETGE